MHVVCEDPALLSACAARSFHHPLGFDKFVLLVADRYEVRLHVWWPGTRALHEHVHDHRFAFVSCTLAGAVQSTVYEEVPHGVLMARYRESRTEGARDYVFHAPELTRVVALARRPHPAGTGYFLSPEVLHRVWPVANTGTATLVVKVPTPRTTTTVLMDPLSKPPARIRRRFLDTDTTRARLLRAAKWCAREV
ncbi:hypothetical protein ACFVZW_36440 [Streptomyces sp. NPDC059567]|uniref:hypothetical protein n=1 Tax=Streptomyces sp. NPDC059567 TaxID=3346867 RepID=UPI0036CAABB5